MGLYKDYFLGLQIPKIERDKSLEPKIIVSLIHLPAHKKRKKKEVQGLVVNLKKDNSCPLPTGPGKIRRKDWPVDPNDCFSHRQKKKEEEER